MAKRKACIDRELFDLVKEYANTHDKDKCCAHFKISLSFLNRILRYNSYEEMRFKIRERARERYAENKKKKEAEKLKNNEEIKMPKIEPPVASTPPINEEVQEDWKQRYEEVMTDYNLAKSRHEELQADNIKFKEEVRTLASLAKEYKEKWEATSKVASQRLQEINKLKDALGQQAISSTSDNTLTIKEADEIVIEIGRMKITCGENKNAKN